MPHDDDPDEFDDDGAEYDTETDYDPEDPETYPAGLYVDSERALTACRHCRADIDEEAEQCPKCGMDVTEEDAPRERKSALWIVLMFLALLVALIWVFL